MAFGNRLTRFIYKYSPAFIRNIMTTEYSRQRGQVKFGPKYYEYLADLERTQWYSNQELQVLQDEKVRRLVNYAYRFVPYYTALMDRLGVHPEQIHSAVDLTRFPILEKDTIRQNNKDFRSTLYRTSEQVEAFHTSGTTGQALDIFATKECLQLEKAFTWLYRSWAGWKLGDKTAAFVGFPFIPVSQTRPPFWVHDSIENRMMYSLQHMSEKLLPDFAGSLQEFAPAFIYGYPNAIYLMAAFLGEHPEYIIRPRAIMTSSETLLSYQREVIESAFSCRIFDWYGATEFIANIVQCEQGNYHIKEEYGVVEVLMPDGTPAAPGEQGDLICTGLNNLAMPLIRYRVGDTALPAAGTCPCGRGGHLISQITGRVEDVIVTPDGRLISRLDFIFKDTANVEEAQLIQDQVDRLVVQIVRGPKYSGSDTAYVLSNLRERLGDEIKIEFKFVERIPRSASGKFRYVISSVPIGLRNAAQTGNLLHFDNQKLRE